MNHHPSEINLAIEQLLVARLQAALEKYIGTKFPGISDGYIGFPLKNQIGLNRAKQRLVGYTCAIAQKLSKTLELPPLEIAIALAEIVCQQTNEQEFTVQVVDPGWIYLELTDSYLAAWLQHLIQSPPSFQTWGSGRVGSGESGFRGEWDQSPSVLESWAKRSCWGEYPPSKLRGRKPTPPTFRKITPLPPLGETPRPEWLQNLKSKIQNPPPHSSSLFTIQYAHARCCSILQLAHTEELITLQPTDPDLGSALWLFVTPNPIPWLNQQCLYHPAQLALISQLIAILDDLYSPNPSAQPMNWYKAALKLSQDFQTFYSQCRIWGEVKSQNKKLAQTRLGLVLITQSVLRLLLLQLGIVAPSEL